MAKKLFKIIELREKAGLKQVDLARLAGIDPRTLSGIETEKNTTPSGTTLNKIAKALKTTVPRLYRD